MVTVLFSGSAVRYDGTTVLVPAGDVSLTTTVPSGLRMTTVMLMTLLVVSLGTETDATMGVMPVANGMVTDALVLMKSTPGEPGLRSDGDAPGGAPTSVAVVMYCGLPIPTVEARMHEIVSCEERKTRTFDEWTDECGRRGCGRGCR